jgi:hypothetical protein
MLAAEREAQLRHCQSQNDLLHDKVRVLTDNFYSLEAERTRSVADLQASLSTAREQLSHYLSMEVQIDGAIENGTASQAADADEGRRWQCSGGGDTLEGVLGQGHLALPTSTRRRVQQSLALSARCADLERERVALARQCTELERELDTTKRGATSSPSLSCRPRRPLPAEHPVLLVCSATTGFSAVAVAKQAVLAGGVHCTECAIVTFLTSPVACRALQVTSGGRGHSWSKQLPSARAEPRRGQGFSCRRTARR